MWPSKNDSETNAETIDVAVPGQHAAAAPAAPVPKSPFAVDEYSGHGGSYVIDPDTQTRKPNKESAS